jgi:hypothetical protein
MRYLILSVVALVCVQVTFSQKNNPFAQRGADFVESYNLIKKDYDAGNIKTLNEKTLAYYSAKVPLKNSITIGTATEVFKTIQSGKSSLEEVMKKSSVSEAARKMTLEIAYNPRKLNDAEFSQFLVQKNEDIKNSKISEGEKELLYTFSAIGYSLRTEKLAGGNVAGKNEAQGCMVTTPDGSGPMSNAGCIITAAVLGGMMGFKACGILCGLGGAIVAGVAVAIALS